MVGKPTYKMPAAFSRATIQSGGFVKRRVLITGANRGLGLEFVRQCLKRGDTVFAAVRDLDRAPHLEDLKVQIKDRLHIVKIDLSSPTSIDAGIATITSLTRGLDLLINNAGVNAMSRDLSEPARSNVLGQLSTEAMTEMFRINAVGPLLVTQSALALLRGGIKPRIVNISSWMASMAHKSQGGNYGYCASKAALNMITRALAFDLAAEDILAVAINPGWVRTDMGGPNAPIDPEASVASTLKVVNGLQPEDSGLFLEWDGRPHPW